VHFSLKYIASLEYIAVVSGRFISFGIGIYGKNTDFVLSY